MPSKMKPRQVCKDFIRLYLTGQEVDAPEVANRMVDLWGIRVDWHETGYALEDLAQVGEVTRMGTGYDGMARYFVEVD